MFLIAYTYLLYPAILFALYSFVQIWRDLRFLNVRGDRRVCDTKPLPSVSIVVAAHDEEAALPATIVNLQQLDYPADLIEIIFVSDGSRDLTNQILRGLEIEDARFHPVLLPQRGGKANAINHGVRTAHNEILVLSDASTLLARDAIQKLVRHFVDVRVGAVCGALQFKGSVESQQSEGTYWKYESILRLMEARLGATLNASGALYSLRRNCYQPIPAGTILDDLIIPMNVRRLGYTVVYDPEAVAYEVPAESVRGEFKRRMRIALGSFWALLDLIGYPLNGITAFAFISHKLLRWAVPILQVILLVSNVALRSKPYYALLLSAQLVFYCWAILGFFFHDRLLRFRFALLPYFLTAMNAAYLIGLGEFLRGRRKVSWEKVT